MGKQRSYSWEFKLQMVQLLEKGEQKSFQISRDHHVTRSLLYVCWQLYREGREVHKTARNVIEGHTRHIPSEEPRTQLCHHAATTGSGVYCCRGLPKL